MSEVKTHNTEGMTKHDIASEYWRKYVYGNGDVYEIASPLILYLKQDERGDSHRIVDTSGTTHYVRRGWVAIQWKSNPEVEF